MINDGNFQATFDKFYKANPAMWRIMLRKDDKPSDFSPDRVLTSNKEMEWFRYLARKGMGHRLRTWRSILARGRSIIVPSEDPAVFDLWDGMEIFSDNGADRNSQYFARYNDPNDILYRGHPTATWTTDNHERELSQESEKIDFAALTRELAFQKSVQLEVGEWIPLGSAT